MKKLIVGLLIGTSVLMFSGCGASKYESAYEDALMATADKYNSAGSASYSTEYAAEEAMSEDYLDVEGNSSGSVDAETVGESAASSRKLITTVTIDAEATDVRECSDKIKVKVNQYDGYIEYESCGETSGNYTIRIPSKNLEAFLSNIDEYSNVTYHTSSVEDVTLSYVDIEARISTLRTEQTRLEEFMAQAETVEDIITIEDRLTDVRYELQSYESQKRTYDNKIDYSTVHLNITEVSTYTPPEKSTIGERIRAGLSDNFEGFVETMGDLLVGIATVLPILILALLPIGILFCIIFFPVNASVKKREAKRRAENELRAKAEADAVDNNEVK